MQSKSLCLVQPDRAREIDPHRRSKTSASSLSCAHTRSVAGCLTSLAARATTCASSAHATAFAVPAIRRVQVRAAAANTLCEVQGSTFTANTAVDSVASDQDRARG